MSATDAPGTIITSNTIGTDCGFGIDLEGTSTGVTIENNIVDTATYNEVTNAPTDTPCATGSDDTGITVAPDAETGALVSHNLIASNGGGPAYSWDGLTYATVAGFAAASGQGAHDLVTDPEFDGSWSGDSPAGVSDGSPAIDSADANAPGELATDVRGKPRVDDPSVANTGTGSGYYDRGAYEFDQFGGTFTPIAPVRVLDTRNRVGAGTNTPVGPGGEVVLPVDRITVPPRSC